MRILEIKRQMSRVNRRDAALMVGCALGGCFLAMLATRDPAGWLPWLWIGAIACGAWAVLTGSFYGIARLGLTRRLRRGKTTPRALVRRAASLSRAWFLFWHWSCTALCLGFAGAALSFLGTVAYAVVLVAVPVSLALYMQTGIGLRGPLAIAALAGLSTPPDTGTGVLHWRARLDRALAEDAAAAQSGNVRAVVQQLHGAAHDGALRIPRLPDRPGETAAQESRLRLRAVGRAARVMVPVAVIAMILHGVVTLPHSWVPPRPGAVVQMLTGAADTPTDRDDPAPKPQPQADTPPVEIAALKGADPDTQPEANAHDGTSPQEAGRDGQNGASGDASGTARNPADPAQSAGPDTRSQPDGTPRSQQGTEQNAPDSLHQTSPQTTGQGAGTSDGQSGPVSSGDQAVGAKPQDTVADTAPGQSSGGQGAATDTAQAQTGSSPGQGGEPGAHGASTTPGGGQGQTAQPGNGNGTEGSGADGKSGGSEQAGPSGPPQANGGQDSAGNGPAAPSTGSGQGDANQTDGTGSDGAAAGVQVNEVPGDASDGPVIGRGPSAEIPDIPPSPALPTPDDDLPNPASGTTGAVQDALFAPPGQSPALLSLDMARPDAAPVPGAVHRPTQPLPDWIRQLAKP